MQFEVVYKALKAKDFHLSDGRCLICNEERLYCVDTRSFDTVFSLNFSFFYFTKFKEFIISQIENGGDVYIYNLDGDLLDEIDGSFFLWKNVISKDKLVFRGKFEGEKYWYYLDDYLELNRVDHLGQKRLLLLKNETAVSTERQKLNAINISSGKSLWEHNLNVLKFKDENSENLKEVIKMNDFITQEVENKLILSSSKANVIIALSIMSGEILWIKKGLFSLDLSKTSEEIYALEKETNYIVVIDPDTGQTKWNIEDWINESYPNLKFFKFKDAMLYEDFLVVPTLTKDIYFLDKNDGHVLGVVELNEPRGVQLHRIKFDFQEEKFFVWSAADKGKPLYIFDKK